MKTMNLFAKLTGMTLALLFCAQVSIGANFETDREQEQSVAREFISLLTNEIKNRVNLNEVANRLEKSVEVTVKVLFTSAGEVKVEHDFSNDPEVADYVLEKLNDINIEFPADYAGKSVVYRFSII